VKKPYEDLSETLVNLKLMCHAFSTSFNAMDAGDNMKASVALTAALEVLHGYHDKLESGKPFQMTPETRAFYDEMGRGVGIQ